MSTEQEAESLTKEIVQMWTQSPVHVRKNIIAVVTRPISIDNDCETLSAAITAMVELKPQYVGGLSNRAQLAKRIDGIRELEFKDNVVEFQWLERYGKPMEHTLLALFEQYDKYGFDQMAFDVVFFELDATCQHPTVAWVYTKAFFSGMNPEPSLRDVTQPDLVERPEGEEAPAPIPVILSAYLTSDKIIRGVSALEVAKEALDKLQVAGVNPYDRMVFLSLVDKDV